AARRLSGRHRHRHDDDHDGNQEGRRRLPVHEPGAVQGHPGRAGEVAQGQPTVIGTAVPANLAGRPGIFVAPPQWKGKAYIINDEVRAKNLPAWREWFTSNIVKK